MTEIIHKRECFIVGGKVFDTREEAEEYRLELIKSASVQKLQKWFLDNKYNFISTGDVSKKLNQLGFFHDGVER